MKTLLVLLLLSAVGCGSVEDATPTVVACPADGFNGTPHEIPGAGGQVFIYFQSGDMFLIEGLTANCCVQAPAGYVPDGTECGASK